MTVIETPVRDEPAELSEFGEIFLKAAQIIRERGLLKEDYGFSGGPRCTMGAIREAKNAEWDSDVSFEAEHFAKFALGKPTMWHIADWNDEPARTRDEVVEALERAAYGA